MQGRSTAHRRRANQPAPQPKVKREPTLNQRPDRDKILSIAARKGYFTTTLRWRDDRIRAFCFHMVEDGALICVGESGWGRHVFRLPDETRPLEMHLTRAWRPRRKRKGRKANRGTRPEKGHAAD